MFKASVEQSERSHQLINQVWSKKVNGGEKYTICYAFNSVRGIAEVNAYNYVVGFSVPDKEIVVLQFNPVGDEIGEPIMLTASDITLAKYGMAGHVKIQSKALKNGIDFYLTTSTSKDSEQAHLLPIIQEQQANDFKKFIKESF